MEVYENPAAILAYLLGFDAFRELLIMQCIRILHLQKNVIM